MKPIFIVVTNNVEICLMLEFFENLNFVEVVFLSDKLFYNLQSHSKSVACLLNDLILTLQAPTPQNGQTHSSN